MYMNMVDTSCKVEKQKRKIHKILNVSLTELEILKRENFFHKN